MSARRGFTLLEVVIALAILAVSLFVLVDSQATAVLMTVDAEKTLTGTYLAQEKMSEAMLRLEEEGFKEGDIDEEGSFEDFGSTDAMGEGPEFGDTFADYKWAYTIREVDLQVGDIAQTAEQLGGAGFGTTGEDGQTEAPDQRSLTDAGFQPDMLSEMLRPYIREIRVLVWWTDEDPDLEEGCEGCIELVTHVINPSGQIIPSDGSTGDDPTAGGGGSTGGGGGTSGGTRIGSGGASQGFGRGNK
ncbi:MAG: prepilin-type N-terminal cleavage/methylation domain-containing protein [Myxococcota bacterium]